MAILRKVRSSTLMETLVASVLILIVFIIASMILNNLFSNSIKNNTNVINTHIKELIYLHNNNKLVLPFEEDYKSWKINIETYKEQNLLTIEFKALNSVTNKSITKKIIETE